MKREQSVPKRRHIKFRRRGITEKKTYNFQNTAKVWNQECLIYERSAHWVLWFPTTRLIKCKMSVLSPPWARHLSRYVTTDTGVLCDTNAVPEVTIKWTLISLISSFSFWLHTVDSPHVLPSYSPGMRNSSATRSEDRLNVSCNGEIVLDFAYYSSVPLLPGYARTETDFATCRSADKSLARPDWKKRLKGRHFSSDAEVIAAAETWLDGQYSDFFFEWLAKVRVWSL